MKLSLKWVIYYAIFLIAGALILSACSTTRKNEKAFSRVLSDEKLFDRMGKRWEQVNPCVESEIVKGKDSIRIDTVFNNDFDFRIDSVYTLYDTVNCKLNIDSLLRKNPYKIYITKTIVRVDTVPDLRRIAIKDAEINNLKGQVSEKDKSVLYERKARQKWMWIFFGLIGLNVLLIVLKFKK